MLGKNKPVREKTAPLAAAAASADPASAARGAALRHDRAWAILALLVAAAHADGDIAREEEIEVGALLTRAPRLLRAEQGDVNAWVHEQTAILRGEGGVEGLVAAAAARLPGERGLRAAVFAHCADIVYADRKLVDPEQGFLRALAVRLGVAERLRKDIIAVIAMKNRY